MKIYFYLRDADDFYNSISDAYHVMGLALSALPPEEDHYFSQRYRCIGDANLNYNVDVIKTGIVADIDRKEKELRAEFQHKLDRLTDRKNQLLALEVKQ